MTNPNVPTLTKYELALDGLRALAVTTVVAFQVMGFAHPNNDHDCFFAVNRLEGLQAVLITAFLPVSLMIQVYHNVQCTAALKAPVAQHNCGGAFSQQNRAAHHLVCHRWSLGSGWSSHPTPATPSYFAFGDPGWLRPIPTGNMVRVHATCADHGRGFDSPEFAYLKEVYADGLIVFGHDLRTLADVRAADLDARAWLEAGGLGLIAVLLSR